MEFDTVISVLAVIAAIIVWIARAAGKYNKNQRKAEQEPLFNSDSPPSRGEAADETDITELFSRIQESGQPTSRSQTRRDTLKRNAEKDSAVAEKKKRSDSRDTRSQPVSSREKKIQADPVVADIPHQPKIHPVISAIRRDAKTAIVIKEILDRPKALR